MYNPVSTYRLQFNKDFSFADARQQVDYFHTLGAGTIYASPVFTATPGSMHGYDITNPHMVNPEIGTEEELRKLTKSLKNRRIGWIQDIVPNHMAFNSYNPWLMDVLEKGKDSEYAGVFDIDRQHPLFRSKLMLPFLGDIPEKVLEKGHITVVFQEGAFFLHYFDHLWPLRFESFLWILEQSTRLLPSSFSLLIDQHQIDDKSPDYLFLNGEWERFKEELHHLCHGQKEVMDFCQNLAEEISQNKDSVKALFENQHYSPVYWKDTEQRINYRRFFTVNDLICLRMEDEEVFNLYHRELRRWLNNHLFDGLRIDHIDGIRYPGEYISRIRKLAGQKRHLSVEKILERHETLPRRWPVQGTTGYDFLGQVNNLLTRYSGMSDLQALYYKITRNEEPTQEVIYQTKKLILSERMQGEWDNLITLFLQLRLLEGEAAEMFNRDQIKETVGEILLVMPVYRLYPESLPLKEDDLIIMKKVFVEVLQRNKDTEPVLSVFEDLLFSEKRSKGDRDHRILHFFSRMMQLAGPLMAKGVEDTAMYRYNCFIGHNEVGDTIGSEGMKMNDFHEQMAIRQEQFPLTLNTTSTHDTKRGEDVRARLNILSEIPEEWEEAVLRWTEMNQLHKKTVNNIKAPSPGEEYLIYQTLTGITPIDGTIDESLINRLETFIEKALREAKEHSSWSRQDTEWEEAVKSFTREILKPGHGFVEDFLTFHRKVAHYGIFNSLSQLTLKCTCPGVPDIYRGNELWDFTLVDPDNRRPVDFDSMHRMLKNLKEHYTLSPAKLYTSLLNNPENGQIKLWLTHRLLRYRKESPSVFASGEYIPLKTKGIHKKNILAFARHHNDVWHVTIVPLFLSSFEEHGKLAFPSGIDWKNTKVLLPENAPSDWINIFTGRPYSTGPEIAVSEVFDAGPVGILHADAGRKARTAGVLMHITSLPGRFSCGDFGPNAYRFVDFLKESGHSYWQVLPFTQTTANGEWSPYSAPSAFAGNILMISPRKLAQESLISKKVLKDHEAAISEKADFTKALSIREELTRSAYENFITHCSDPAKQDFFDFCKKEAYWLDDYAMFLLFKRQFDGKPWNEWPADYRDRNKEVLEKARKENERKVELEKYRQYLFYQHWHELKRYANHHGIRVIGDIPIYVSHDNADVWSHPHLLKLNADKSMKAIAGVPPDYFSETGQLWNMPVFNWKNLEKDNFKWWIQRIAKNLELFDLVRLDHFRGFEAYWEVPANEETAENGTWVKAPGKQFFQVLKKKFPAMPFIAEDLGEIDDEVYKLRDMFQLPGMKILQFAFGDDLPESVHIPHNFQFNSVVYTGTHDNNTAQGWFRFELDKAARKRLKLYTGNKVKNKNVHRILTRLAWASQAKLVVIPIQDLMGKGPEAQMNKPSVAKGNWTWRVKSMDELNQIAGETRELLVLFSR